MPLIKKETFLVENNTGESVDMTKEELIFLRKQIDETIPRTPENTLPVVPDMGCTKEELIYRKMAVYVFTDHKLAAFRIAKNELNLSLREAKIFVENMAADYTYYMRHLGVYGVSGSSEDSCHIFQNLQKV